MDVNDNKKLKAPQLRGFSIVDISIKIRKAHHCHLVHHSLNYQTHRVD